MGSRLAVALVMVAGCNFALGIAEPVTYVDTDRDGIPDDSDNCVAVWNPLQLDLDHNGVGDICNCTPNGLDEDHDLVDDGCDECVGEPVYADSGGDHIDDGCEPCAAATGRDIDHDQIPDECDACTLGPPHDEDGDGIFDACDNCPELPNPLQEIDVDADFVGDMCDPDSDAQRESFFDPFTEPRSDIWTALPPGWSLLPDRLHAENATAIRSTTVDASRDFFLETRFVMVPTASDAKVGIVTANAECTVDSAGILTFTKGAQSQSSLSPVSIAGPVRVRLGQVTLLESGLSSQSCSASDGTSTMSAPPFIIFGGATIGLAGLSATGATVDFDYLWSLTSLITL